MRFLARRMGRHVAVQAARALSTHSGTAIRPTLSFSQSMGRTRPLEDVEREHILAAVETAGGNRTRAALELEIGLATLKRKL